MRKPLLLIALLCLPVLAAAQTGIIQNHSFLGGKKVITSGTNSTNYSDGIIPGASITVYLTNTTTKATIQTVTGGVLANPFFSNAATAVDPGGYVFRAPTNVGYDVVASGGGGNPSCTIQPNCYAFPVTLLTGVYASSSVAPVVNPLNIQTNEVGNASQVLLDFKDTATVLFSNPSGGIESATVPNATSSTKGVVQPDNTTITISAGVISAVSSGCGSVSGDATSTDCGTGNQVGNAGTYVSTFGYTNVLNNGQDDVTAIGTNNLNQDFGNFVFAGGSTNFNDTVNTNHHDAQDMLALGWGNGDYTNGVATSDEADLTYIGSNNGNNVTGIGVSEIQGIGGGNVNNFVNGSSELIGIGDSNLANRPASNNELQEAVGIGDNTCAWSGSSQPTGQTGDDWVCIGDGDGLDIHPGSSDVVLIGDGAGAQHQATVSVTPVSDVIFIGDASGKFNQGNDNVAIGHQALSAQSVGAGVGVYNRGNENVAIGEFPLVANTTGTKNTAIGGYAGSDGYDGSTGFGNSNKTGSNNTWIGYDAGPGTTSQLSNTVALGYQAHNTASNQTTIGNASTNSLKIYGCPSGQTALNDGSGTCYTPGAGGSGITGQIPGYAIEAATTTTATGPFPMDDAISNAGAVTIHKNIVVDDGSGVAGTIALPQGTAASNETTSVSITAPTSVTSYRIVLPGVHATGSNTFLSCTAADPAVCTWAAGGGGGGSSVWSALTDPSADLSLSMAGNLSTFSGTDAMTGSTPIAHLSFGLNSWAIGGYAQNSVSAIVGGANIPSTATKHQVNGIYGETINDSTAVNAVGMYSTSICTRAGSSCWGENPLTQDSIGVGPGVAATLVGSEIDVNVANASTNITGLDINGLWTAQPSSANGITLRRSGGGGTYNWNTGLWITEGMTSYAGLLLDPAASGSSQPSQIVRFRDKDSGGTTRLNDIYADGTGSIVLAPALGIVKTTDMKLTGYQDMTETAAPANPSASIDRLYTDSTTHKLACLTSAGADCMPGVASVSLSSVTAGSTGSGTYDFSGATQLKLPVAAGYTPAADGEVGYDSTNKNWHLWDNGADKILAPLASGFVSGNCGQPTKTGNSWTIQDAGGACGVSGGGSAFSAITTGSNTTATMTVGSGASIVRTGTGIVDANQVNSATVPTSQAYVGTNSSGQIVAASAPAGAWTNITGSSQVTAANCTQSASTGGYCSISGSSTTTATISVIPAHLRMQIVIWGQTSSAGYVTLNFNSDTTSGHYFLNGVFQSGAGAPSGNANASNAACYVGQIDTAGVSQMIADLPFYADTSFSKAVHSRNSVARAASDSANEEQSLSCGFTVTTAITTVAINATAGHFVAGTKFMILAQD